MYHYTVTALLECLTVVLKSIELLSILKEFLSPTLKTLLYLMFTTEKWQCGIPIQ